MIIFHNDSSEENMFSQYDSSLIFLMENKVLLWPSLLFISKYKDKGFNLSVPLRCVTFQEISNAMQNDSLGLELLNYIGLNEIG